ncbi:hypothetical protein EJ02DRAFT_67653 [Clathrospora elynae]|uniref:Uncharacterized protein n=1 Tax=Clathrospora elynae TaxID=706981 RepID=A0A6A5T804_9PLEO|nr:hypothetical protein EJ02DRAFT_67653 [Clathrospora elynae]
MNILAVRLIILRRLGRHTGTPRQGYGTPHRPGRSSYRRAISLRGDLRMHRGSYSGVLPSRCLRHWQEKYVCSMLWSASPLSYNIVSLGSESLSIKSNVQLLGTAVCAEDLRRYPKAWCLFGRSCCPERLCIA